MCECCGGDCKATNFSSKIIKSSESVIKYLEECLKKGFEKVNPYNRPDESLRAMLFVMKAWKDYMSSTNYHSEMMVKRMQDLGRAEERLHDLLKDEIFDTLSKHNPYWDSEYEKESEKLDDLRRKLAYINDNLWDVMAILSYDKD